MPKQAGFDVMQAIAQTRVAQDAYLDRFHRPAAETFEQEVTRRVTEIRESRHRDFERFLERHCWR